MRVHNVVDGFFAPVILPLSANFACLSELDVVSALGVKLNRVEFD